MTNIAQFQIPPPQNWQDFESLCCDLWAQIWNDENTKKHGRSGQPQNGIDIYGYPLNANGGCYGIQCKKKDNSSDSTLTVSELESEIKKATRFSPKIECFIMATTSAKDVIVEKKAREITETNKKNGLFSVHVFGWSDIVEKLSKYPDVMNKYYSWAITANDPNETLFKLWFRDADVKKLKINANTIPFELFDIRFKGFFLNDLQSYLMKIETNFSVPSSSLASQDLRDAIANFNKIANDVINACFEFENKYDIESDLYTYWVDIGNLPYHEQGKFIDYKKGVIKCLFYNLVKAANYVIQIRNSLLHGNCKTEDFIGFRDDFNFNYPLLGKPHPSPEYYPTYSSEELEGGRLYQGLASIEQLVYNHIYDG